MNILIRAVFLVLFWTTGVHAAQHQRPPDPDWTARTLVHDGLTRSYKLYVPEAVGAAPAVVLVLHGSGGDAVQAQRIYMGGFEPLADRHGFLLVYPEGFEKHWNDCRKAAPYSANTADIDDVGFLRAVVGDLVRRDGADPARAFVTGFSNGGQMALKLAFEAPDDFAAIAAVGASHPTTDNCDCTDSGRPANLMILNGDADPINPYQGGEVTPRPQTSFGTVIGTEASAEVWAQRIDAGAPVTRVYDDVDPSDGTVVARRDWTGAGRHVALVTIWGGGHVLPHPQSNPPPMLGAGNRDLNGAELIWDFFSRADPSGN